MKIKVSELKPGMSFNTPIKFSDKWLLRGPFLGLNSDFINHLLKLKIKEVDIAGDFIQGKPDDTKEEAKIQYIDSPSQIENLRKEKISSQDVGSNELFEKYIAERNTFFTEYRIVYEKSINIFNDIYKNNNINLSDLIDIVNRCIKMTRRFPVIHMLPFIVENKNLFYFHSLNTVFISLCISLRINMQPQNLVLMGAGALLHDVGVLYLMEKRLQKTIETYKPIDDYMIPEHPIIGYKKLSKINGIGKGILVSVLQHHERINGMGFPQKTKEKKIHLFAKILGLIDQFEKDLGKHFDEKLIPYTEILTGIIRRKGQFPQNLVKILADSIMEYPIGIEVQYGEQKGIIIDKFDNKYLIKFIDQSSKELMVSALEISGIVK